jgi:ribosomal protein S18 acetylase RimI-like enzyme
VHAGAAARKIASKWEAARLVLRRGGVGILLERALRRSLAPIGTWHKLVFFERDLADEMPEIRSRFSLEMHVVGADQISSYRALLDGAGQDWDEMTARAARGDQCTIVLSEGRLVHLRWLSVTAGLIPELGATLLLAPGEAYVYASFTLPEARGSRVQPAVSTLMMQRSRAQGYRWHLFYVRGDDPSALAIVAKVGARRTRVVRCLRLTSGNGLWVLGLRANRPPCIEFDSAAAVRRLGLLGLWVRGPGI